MKNAIILCRVSSKEQEETGYSLPAQEDLLKKYAIQKGLKIAKIFAISESASGQKQRLVFNQMMKHIKKNNIKVLVVEKADRLTRNFKDMVMIDEWLEKDEEREVHLVKDSLVMHKNSKSQEKLNWGIRILFAKNQIDNLSEEVKKGQLGKLDDGWLPTKPPAGYKTIGEQGKRVHVIDSERAPLIKEMFELYASGVYSLKKLTETMTRKGLVNDNGNPYQKSRIHFFLTNPFYVGINVWNDKQYQGKQETFISKELFDKVQRTLQSKTTPKYRKHMYLFKGLIECKECEGTITWETQRGHIYGHCNHYHDCSQKTWSKEHEVEEQIKDVLKVLVIKNSKVLKWVRKALKEHHKGYVEARTVSSDSLNKIIARLENRLDKIYEDKLDGVITESMYNRKKGEYLDQISQTKSQLDKNTEDNVQYYQLGLNYYDLAQKGALVYSKAGLEKKQLLVRTIFKELKLDEGELSFKFNRAFEILFEIANKANRSKVSKSVEILLRNFEHKEYADMEGQMAQQDTDFGQLLPQWDSTRTKVWVDSFLNHNLT